MVMSHGILTFEVWNAGLRSMCACSMIRAEEELTLAKATTAQP